MTKLSDTQRVFLSADAQREMGLARAPNTLPAAARNAVFRSLIKNNLLTEINAPPDFIGLGWRQDDDGTWIVARISGHEVSQNTQNRTTSHSDRLLQHYPLTWNQCERISCCRFNGF